MTESTVEVPVTTEQSSSDVVRAHSAEAAGAAKDRAGDVANHAAGATSDVKDTAVEHAGRVKDETVRQARDLMGEARSQMSSQASDQVSRLVSNLRSVADELRQMASHGNGGVASEMAHQLADRAHSTANTLDGREPGDLLDEARRFARRRPGAFLAGAAVLGFLSGRLGRGIKDAQSDGGSITGGTTARGYAGEPYPTETLGTMTTGVGPTAGSDLTAAPDAPPVSAPTGTGYGEPSYTSGRYGETPTYAPGTTGYEPSPGTAVGDPLAGTQMDPSEPVNYGLDDETREFRTAERRTEGY